MDRAKRIVPAQTPGPSRPAWSNAELAGMSVGQRIAFFRCRLGMAQLTLAERVGRSESWLSKVDRGDRGCDSLTLIVALAEVLKVPPAALIDVDLTSSRPREADKGVPTQSAQRGPSVAVAGWASGVQSALEAVNGRLRSLERRIEEISQALLSPDRLIDGGEGAMMVWLATTIDGRPALVPLPLPRRKVLAAGGASLLAWLSDLLDPDELGRVDAVVAQPSRADLGTVGHLEALLAHYRGLDDLMGPRRLLVPVRSSLDLVDGLVRDARPPVRQALVRLSAQYEQLTGWLRQDSGDRARARRSYDRAITRATEGGDHALARYVLACKSQEALHAGQADTAVSLAQAAQTGEERLTPAVHAWAADVEARAWALDGKPDACKAKLDESAALLTESAVNGRADEPPWIYWYAEETLAVHRGVCLTDFGEAGAAIEVFDGAITALPAERIRDRAYYLACSAGAHAADRDPEQAGAVAQKAARIAIDTGATGALEKLHSCTRSWLMRGRTCRWSKNSASCCARRALRLAGLDRTSKGRLPGVFVPVCPPSAGNAVDATVPS